MLKRISPLASEDESFSWWWFGIQVGVVAALVILWLLNRQKKRKLIPKNLGVDSLGDAKSIPLPDEPLDASESALPAQPKPTKADDLRKIEGIGPKIQATLQASGIETFSQLAAAKPEEIKEILRDAGVRIGYPDTWPEQAALAAKAKWDALADLQSTLQGGRRVA